MSCSFAKTSQLNIITTNKCNAACSHCIMCSGKGRTETLSFEQIKRNIDQMIDLSDSKSMIVFTGGEPTLLGDDLLESIAYADGLDISTRIVTNAHWAKTPQSAESMIQKLLECGLSEINISTDDYHEKYVPFDNIVNAWNACKGKGFNAVVIAVCYSKNSKITPHFIESKLNEKIQYRFDSKGQEKKLKKRAEDGTIYGISNTFIQKVGRAAFELDDAMFSFKKNSIQLYGGCPNVAKMATVSPSNHLWACCGIECKDDSALDLGDLSKKSYKAILNDCEKNVFIKSIETFGPMYLKEFLLSQNPCIMFKNKYSSVCAICEDIVRNKEAIETIKANATALWNEINDVRGVKKECN